MSIVSSSKSNLKGHDSGHPAEGWRLPWGAIAAIVVAIGSYFVAQIFAVLLFSAIAPQSDLAQAGQTDIELFVLLLLISVFEFIFVYVYIKLKGGRLRDLKLLKPKLKEFTKVIPAYVAYFVLLLGASTVAGLYLSEEVINQEQNIGFTAGGQSGLELLFIFVSLVVVPPVLEEIVFRGFMFRGLVKNGLKNLLTLLTASLVLSLYLLPLGGIERIKQAYRAFEGNSELVLSYVSELVSPLALFILALVIMHKILGRKNNSQNPSTLDYVSAAIISSGLFALAHAQINVGIDTFILGLVSCWLLVKSQSIWPSIALHSLKNGIAFLLLFVLDVSM